MPLYTVVRFHLMPYRLGSLAVSMMILPGSVPSVQVDSDVIACKACLSGIGTQGTASMQSPGGQSVQAMQGRAHRGQVGPVLSQQRRAGHDGLVLRVLPNLIVLRCTAAVSSLRSSPLSCSSCGAILSKLKACGTAAHAAQNAAGGSHQNDVEAIAHKILHLVQEPAPHSRHVRSTAACRCILDVSRQHLTHSSRPASWL